MNVWFDHQCEKRKDGIKSSFKKIFRSIRKPAEGKVQPKTERVYNYVKQQKSVFWNFGIII